MKPEKPRQSNEDTTEETLIRILLIVGLILALLGCAIFAMLALGVDIAGWVEKIVQHVKHLI